VVGVPRDQKPTSVSSRVTTAWRRSADVNLAQVLEVHPLRLQGGVARQ
jgi:hypothetical protein